MTADIAWFVFSIGCALVAVGVVLIVSGSRSRKRALKAASRAEQTLRETLDMKREAIDRIRQLPLPGGPVAGWPGATWRP